MLFGVRGSGSLGFAGRVFCSCLVSSSRSVVPWAESDVLNTGVAV